MVTREQLSLIRTIIIDTANPLKIYLFGSYAYGKPTEKSDLDILVLVSESDLPRYKRACEIRKKLWHMTDISTDILVYTEQEADDWKNVPAAFITSIIDKGKLLYEKQK